MQMQLKARKFEALARQCTPPLAASVGGARRLRRPSVRSARGGRARALLARLCGAAAAARGPDGRGAALEGARVHTLRGGGVPPHAPSSRVAVSRATAARVIRRGVLLCDCKKEMAKIPRPTRLGTSSQSLSPAPLASTHLDTRPRLTPTRHLDATPHGHGPCPTRHHPR